MGVKKTRDYRGQPCTNCLRCKKSMLQTNKNAPYCSLYCKNKPQPIVRNCILCGTPYYHNQAKVKYCSKKCKMNSERRPYSRFCLTDLAPATVGAIAELMACVDLMKNGYEVFRAMSPASNCDILGIKDGVVHLYEVRTGSYIKTEKGKKLVWQNRKSEGKEMIVITYEDGAIHFIPGNINCSSVYVKQDGSYEPVERWPQDDHKVKSLSININSKIE